MRTGGTVTVKTTAFEISCNKVNPRPLNNAANIPEKPNPAEIGYDKIVNRSYIRVIVKPIKAKPTINKTFIFFSIIKGRTSPPIIPDKAIPNICKRNKVGKLRPEPIGFNPEYIPIAVNPTNPPQPIPRFTPDRKTITVINSMFGINISEKPIPTAIAQKIDALIKLFSCIRSFQ